MSDSGELREDLKIPEGELGAQLKADYESGKELLVCIMFMLYALEELNVVHHYSFWVIMRN